MATIPAFRTGADAITADVVVTGKDGRPVRGLTREDFTLLEDGKPLANLAFEARDSHLFCSYEDPPVARGVRARAKRRLNRAA